MHLLLSQSTDFLALLLLVIIVATGFFMKSSKNSQPDRVGIKITRSGRRVYEPIPEEPEQKIPFWLLALYVVVGLAVLFIPAHYYLNRS